jgi:hypothetical protein
MNGFETTQHIPALHSLLVLHSDVAAIDGSSIAIDATNF